MIIARTRQFDRKQEAHNMTSDISSGDVMSYDYLHQAYFTW